MRPRWAALESGHAEAVWRDAEPRFYSQVVGPRFEQLCREFAALAPDEMFGGPPGEVGSGVLTDPEAREQIQLDQVVLAPAVSGEQRRVLAIGEAKWGKELGARQASRLIRARELLTQKGFETRDTAIALFSGAGFAPGLTTELPGERIVTIGLDTLYGAP